MRIRSGNAAFIECPFYRPGQISNHAPRVLRLAADPHLDIDKATIQHLDPDSWTFGFLQDIFVPGYHVLDDLERLVHVIIIIHTVITINITQAR